MYLIDLYACVLNMLYDQFFIVIVSGAQYDVIKYWKKNKKSDQFHFYYVSGTILNENCSDSLYK